MTDLVDSLRSEMPPRYEALPGFRGLLVLEKPGARHHVIALTLWEDEAGVAASDAVADHVAERIAEAAGTAASRSVYRVLGSMRVAEPKESVL